jgi:hypothetical protein
MLTGIRVAMLGVDRSAYRMVDGRLRVPEAAPGFGMRLAVEG